MQIADHSANEVPSKINSKPAAYADYRVILLTV